ncbi:unnamed protein product [Angiostrongylus costaricensis]|uniref:DUF676 domain-containing protein n=1 Tax=Angiostrongylus costaricensis TaxID=334426 RepID=A0A158PLI8_ANGCS|nr:unnamed protein product [Angiostrongylus costaricensis]
MAVELHPVFNVNVILDELRNIDLTTRGYYQIRLIPKTTSHFTSVDIQCSDFTSTNGNSFILSSSVVHGSGVSKTVEVTYIDETLTLGKCFLMSMLSLKFLFSAIQWQHCPRYYFRSMDRHRPPNFDLFELESRRTIEISLCPARLTAASRLLFFEHSAYAALTLSVYASLVSVLPRRKRLSPDEVGFCSNSRNFSLIFTPFLPPTLCCFQMFSWESNLTILCDVSRYENISVVRVLNLVLRFSSISFQMISIVLKSKYLEKLPRFPIFCADLDNCISNWCEYKFLMWLPVFHSVFFPAFSQPFKKLLSLGTCDDLSSYRNIFRVISGCATGFCYLLSEANHAKTWSDIDDLAQNLLSEVQSYIARLSEPPARISFVAHSLGGVIVRAAVCRKDAEKWLTPRLHSLLTINTPHLGLAYVGRSVNLGMQLMQWWKHSRSIQQLSLKDEVTYYESFLFRLSRQKTFGLFRRVLLVGTCGDTFVPFHSALLVPCKAAMKDPSALGTTYRLATVHYGNCIR